MNKLFSTGFNFGGVTSATEVLQLRRSFRRKNASKLNEILSSSKQKVLIVDDDEFALLRLVNIFNDLDMLPVSISSRDAALLPLISEHFDLVILDWNLDKGTAFDLMTKVGELFWAKDKACIPTPLITCSVMAHDQVELPEVTGFLPYGHWQKPINKSVISHDVDEINALKIIAGG